MQTAIVGGLGALAIGSACYAAARTRRLLVRIVSPDLIRTSIGIGVGFLAGTPTIVRQFVFFLRSVDFYSTYIDVDRVGWPFWKLGACNSSITTWSRSGDAGSRLSSA